MRSSEVNRHELPTFTRRLESVLPCPVRLTVTRTLPVQPFALLTPLGSLIVPRVVNRYESRGSRRGLTDTDSPGRLRFADAAGVESFSSSIQLHRRSQGVSAPP